MRSFALSHCTESSPAIGLSLGDVLVWPCGISLCTCTHLYSVKDSRGPLSTFLKLALRVALLPRVRPILTTSASYEFSLSPHLRKNGGLNSLLGTGNYLQTESLGNGRLYLNCSLFSGLTVCFTPLSNVKY